MASATYRIGDWVVYTRSKASPHPGPRAKNVDPTTAGDDYTYTVDKYWVVRDVDGQGWLKLATRRGKIHQVDPLDPNLRPASWLERLWFRQRFRDAARARTG